MSSICGNRPLACSPLLEDALCDVIDICLEVLEPFSKKKLLLRRRYKLLSRTWIVRFWANLNFDLLCFCRSYHFYTQLHSGFISHFKSCYLSKNSWCIIFFSYASITTHSFKYRFLYFLRQGKTFLGHVRKGDTEKDTSAQQEVSPRDLTSHNEGLRILYSLP